MKLYDLGTIPWYQTQLVYHSLARAGEHSVVICTPKEQYACVGFHQDPAQELDVDFCNKHDIGIFRREIGGGTVFLDEAQIFFQVIIDREQAPLDQNILFRKYLGPVIKTCEALGLNAQYNPICDLVVNGKKISGNGGGDIGDCKVVTGSILLDFDFKTMSKILNLPSEEFRHNVYETMVKNLTTVKNELGYIPSKQEIISILISKWEDMFGTLEPSKLDSTVLDLMSELEKKFLSKDWLYRIKKSECNRTIKIIEGLNLIYDISNGVEICIETMNERIRNIEIYSTHSQDLKSHLNDMLIGKKFDATLVLNTINTISKS